MVARVRRPFDQLRGHAGSSLPFQSTTITSPSAPSSTSRRPFSRSPPVSLELAASGLSLPPARPRVPPVRALSPSCSVSVLLRRSIGVPGAAVP